MTDKDKSTEPASVTSEGAGLSPATDLDKAPEFTIVTLDVPIKRGNTIIDSVTLRRPNPGALRGLSLIDLVMMNVTALQKLLPRITQPALTENEIMVHVDPADLTAMGIEVAGFLARNKDKQAYQ